MDEKQLQEFKELEKAATPGKWEAIAGKNDFRIWTDTATSVIVGVIPQGMPFFPTAENAQADAAFIAAARTAVPELIAEVERLRNALTVTKQFSAVAKANNKTHEALWIEAETLRQTETAKLVAEVERLNSIIDKLDRHIAMLQDALHRKTAALEAQDKIVIDAMTKHVEPNVLVLRERNLLTDLLEKQNAVIADLRRQLAEAQRQATL